jgi:Lon protease-like protein
VKRRQAIQLLAMSAAGLCTGHGLRASSLHAEQDPSGRELLLPLFPLDLVLLPHTNLPLHIFEPRYKEMIGDCLQNGWEFGILAVQGQSVESLGCTASITKVLERFPDGRMNIIVRGQRRFEISQIDEARSYLRGQPQFVDDDPAEDSAPDLRERAMALYGRLKELADIATQALQETPTFTDTQLSYRLIAGVPAELSWQQNLLELRSERRRLEQVVRYFEEVIEQLESTPDKRPTPGRGVAGTLPGVNPSAFKGSCAASS